ncbi:hypothetical protein ACO0LV_07970 [Pseudactinotalea sp. Z1739]|uniref:hypothetical protein n=1 Tax=Pseudactinotalea sp. Z1739 TaxID=3413028 RepID=UPI003C7CB92B
MTRSASPRTWRFSGRIAGWGTAGGTRFVVGNWHTTPLGPFAGVMVQHPHGHRVLLAPSTEVAEFVSATYQFDAVEPANVTVHRYAPRPPAGARARDAVARGVADPGSSQPPVPAEALPRTVPTMAGERWQIGAGPLSATVQIGERAAVGWLLRALPAAVAGAPWFTLLTDPVARVALPGVRTRGSAGGGRREYYGASDLHRLAGARSSWDGTDLGAMVPIDPPVRFGFASTPATPSLTDLVTTVRGGAP